jgi:membrane protease YdiL (CAAX protease family)
LSPQEQDRTPAWIMRTWDRLPPPVRAVLSGLFVFITLQIGWNIFVVLNLETTPAIPWHAPAGLIYLWFMFRYFSGQWSPGFTVTRRREALGARALAAGAWPPALLACAAVAIFIIAFTMLNYRLIPIPEDSSDFSMYPWWTVYSALIMVSIVAGVAEEAGFRGYMQGPLVKRYGSVVGIAISSLIFWLVHLNHPSGLSRGPSLVAYGIVLGALSYAAGSILPAIITHAAADSMVFVGAYSVIGPAWLWSPPPFSESGLDGPMAGTLLVAVVAGTIAVAALRRLHTLTAR